MTKKLTDGPTVVYQYFRPGEHLQIQESFLRQILETFERPPRKRILSAHCHSEIIPLAQSVCGCHIT